MRLFPNLSRSIASADLSSVCCTDFRGQREILITSPPYRVLARSGLTNSQEEVPSSQPSTRFTFNTSRWPRCHPGVGDTPSPSLHSGNTPGAAHPSLPPSLLLVSRSPHYYYSRLAPKPKGASTCRTTCRPSAPRKFTMASASTPTCHATLTFPGIAGGGPACSTPASSGSVSASTKTAPIAPVGIGLNKSAASTQAPPSSKTMSIPWSTTA